MTHLTDCDKQLALLNIRGTFIEPRKEPRRRTDVRIWRDLETVAVSVMRGVKPDNLWVTHKYVTVSRNHNLIEHCQNVIIFT